MKPDIGTEQHSRGVRRKRSSTLRRIALFVHKHRVAVSLIIAAVLVVAPARRVGTVHYRILSFDVQVPGGFLVLAAFLIGFLLGAAWIRARNTPATPGSRMELPEI